MSIGFLCLCILQSCDIKSIKVCRCSIFSVCYLYYYEIFLFVPITLHSIIFDFDVAKSALFLIAFAAYLVSIILFCNLVGFCSFLKPVFHFLSFKRPTNLTFVMMTLCS